MTSNLKAEYRKLMTVPSTYWITGIVLLIIGLLAFFANGYKSAAGQLGDPLYLYDGVLMAFNFVAFFAALVGILLVTHEYRYNTIMHTLTASSNRLKILLAKAAVASLYSLALSLLVIVLTVGLILLGVRLQGADLAPQNLELPKLLAHTLFFTWSYAMYGIILAFLIRSQVASIMVILIGSSIIEALLGLIFKGNAKYLPFSAADAVLSGGGSSGAAFGPQLTSGTAALVVLGYVAVLGALAWLLFRRRDAN